MSNCQTGTLPEPVCEHAGHLSELGVHRPAVESAERFGLYLEIRREAVSIELIQLLRHGSGGPVPFHFEEELIYRWASACFPCERRHVLPPFGA